MHKILTYFCKANPNKLRTLEFLIQCSIIRDLFTEIGKFSETNFKNNCVLFPAFFLNFLKTLFHFHTFLLRGSYLCIVSILLIILCTEYIFLTNLLQIVVFSKFLDFRKIVNISLLDDFYTY